MVSGNLKFESDLAAEPTSRRRPIKRRPRRARRRRQASIFVAKLFPRALIPQPSWYSTVSESAIFAHFPARRFQH